MCRAVVCLLYLTIGPLFAIPRCATVSFTTGITPLLGADSPEWLYLLVFSAAFFAFVLFFSLRPGKITLWIGKIINPLFLFFFAVLIIAALLSPGAAISSVEPTEAYQNGSFFPALIEGYGTMDAIAGLAFGIVVIDVIRRMGVNNDDIIAEDVLSSGLLAGALMALIYVLSILVGAQSRGIFELSENGGIALTQIAGHYLGGVGQFILAFTITFACLKTSIGLVTACSETFVKMTNGKISYRTCGEKTWFAYTDKEKNDIVKTLEGKRYKVDRSKGLGQNDPEMMWLTTMNPETRRLIKIMPEDAEATAHSFDLLLGDNLQGRKDHIAENGYKYLEMIDVS